MRLGKIYRVVIRVPKDGLVTYRIRVAASSKDDVKEHVKSWLLKRGLTLDFNASLEVLEEWSGTDLYVAA